MFVYAEFVNPMAQIPSKGPLVDRKVVVKRYERSRPDTFHVGARVGFGVVAGILFHFSSPRGVKRRMRCQIFSLVSGMAKAR
jgi:hypothetical protein